MVQCEAIYIGLHCEGRFANIDVEKFSGVKKLQGFGLNRMNGRTSIFTVIPPKLDDLLPTVTAMKNLIEGTYPVIEKILRGA